MKKPFAPACERNKEPILEIIKNTFREPGSLLEIGSGTGQHAVYFATHMPHILWQPTDLADNLPAIKMWTDEIKLINLHSPKQLDVNQQPWPVEPVDYIFTANTLHIISWTSVVNFFQGASQALKSGGHLCIYGPFNYHGEYTSESNAQFDIWLKQKDPVSAIRDFDDITHHAEKADTILQADYTMPANNRLLHWRKK